MTPRIHLVVALAALVGGCGSGNADAFVGDWTYTGSIMPNCIGITIPDFPLDGSVVTITKVDDEHVRVTLDTSCVVTFAVDGDRASAPANSVCTLEVPTLGPQQITITSWTLTLASGGMMMTSQFQGSAFAVCMPSGTGTLTRAAAGS
jgi:hypothetical protein